MVEDTCWSRTSNVFQEDWLAGIGFLAIHPPQANWKKSSQGSTEVFIELINAAAFIDKTLVIV